MSPFLAWGDFHACSRFARSTIPEEKWGTTRSLIYLQHLILPVGPEPPQLRISDNTRDNSTAWTHLLNFHFNYLILLQVQINVTISPLLWLLTQIEIWDICPDPRPDVKEVNRPPSVSSGKNRPSRLSRTLSDFNTVTQGLTWNQALSIFIFSRFSASLVRKAKKKIEQITEIKGGGHDHKLHRDLNIELLNRKMLDFFTKKKQKKRS